MPLWDENLQSVCFSICCQCGGHHTSSSTAIVTHLKVATSGFVHRKRAMSWLSAKLPAWASKEVELIGLLHELVAGQACAGMHTLQQQVPMVSMNLSYPPQSSLTQDINMARHECLLLCQRVGQLRGVLPPAKDVIYCLRSGIWYTCNVKDAALGTAPV
jgi:hypothetical protein